MKAIPIRIPYEAVIGSVEPPIIGVGHIGTWTLECEFPKDIPAGCYLNFLVGGTRWIKSEMICQSCMPHKENYVSAHIMDDPRLYRLLPGPDTNSGHLQRCAFRVPPKGIRKGTKMRIIMGDTSHGSPGMMGPRISMRNAFFAIEVTQTIPCKESESGHLGKYLFAFLMDFVGGPMEQLRLFAPSQAIAGKPFSLTVRAQDRFGNISSELPLRLVFDYKRKKREIGITEKMINPAGALEINGFTVKRSGIVCINVEDPDTGLSTQSNPIQVMEHIRTNLYWGVMHEHTELSDGTGSVDFCYTNYRHGARLDFGAVSDHDNMYETTDEMWKTACKAAETYNVAGEFAAFLGYECSNWRRKGDGHKNVYYLDDNRPMFRSETGKFDTPEKLFSALSEEKALVIPPHTACAEYFCDWKDHDPKVERLVEIYSVQGNSEMAADQGNPLPVRKEEPIGFAQNALYQGCRVGFTAGGDMHRSYPGGDVRKGVYKIGLTGVWARDRTRLSIWDALFARRCFGTTGARMILKFSVNGYPMGSEFNMADEPEARGKRKIEVYVYGTKAIEKVDVICNNQTIYAISPKEDVEVYFIWEDKREFREIAVGPTKWCSKPFAFYYIRIRQIDGEMAWASPVWIDG